MPRQGQSVESCILVAWKIARGDTVKQGDIIADIETDKAVFELESPAGGTLLEFFCEEGDDIPVLQNIAAIGEPGEDASALRPDSEESARGGKSGEEKPPSAAPSEEAAERAGAPRPGAGNAPGISPRARRLAAEKGIHPDELRGTGPGGRIIEVDVAEAAAARAAMSPAAVEAFQSGKYSSPHSGSGPGGMVLSSDLKSRTGPSADKEIPVKGIRKIIAERMHHSLSSTAQLTLNTSFNAVAIQNYRKEIKEKGPSMGMPNITLNDMIVHSTVQVLKNHPELNAHFLGDRIIQFAGIHIGVAIDTPRGLMVPNIKSAQTLSLGDISSAIKPVAESCQAGNVDPDLLSGGTFTITNLGALGIESFTPILNAPEVAVLGVGCLTFKTVQNQDGFSHVPAINLSLTIDHQAVDGAPAARFLQDLVAALENFEQIINA